MENHHKAGPEESRIHQKFVEYGRNAKEWMRKCVLLLPEIAKHEIWRKKGFGSIYEYAARLAGMSHNTVDDALRILRKIEDKPALQKVVAEKGLHAVRPVATIATQETEKFWAAKAREMSKNTLEVYIKAFRGISRPRTGNVAENPQQQAIDVTNEQVAKGLTSQDQAPQTIIVMNLDPAVAQKLQKIKGQGSWDDLMREFLKMREEKIEQEKPEPLKTESRHIPNKIKKYVLSRTNKTCAFPDCDKPVEIFHHTQRFSLEKIHDPDQIVALCKAHERIAHHGLIENEESLPDFWKVREHADQGAPKFKIDQMVAKYRRR